MKITEWQGFQSFWPPLREGKGLLKKSPWFFSSQKEGFLEEKYTILALFRVGWWGYTSHFFSTKIGMREHPLYIKFAKQFFTISLTHEQRSTFKSWTNHFFISPSTCSRRLPEWEGSHGLCARSGLETHCQSKCYVLPCPCEQRNSVEPFNPIRHSVTQYYMILYVHLY